MKSKKKTEEFLKQRYQPKKRVYFLQFLQRKTFLINNQFFLRLTSTERVVDKDSLQEFVVSAYSICISAHSVVSDNSYIVVSAHQW